MMKIENLKLTQEWDKTFPKSEKVDRRLRPLRRSQGAVRRPLRADHGRAWLFDDCL